MHCIGNLSDAIFFSFLVPAGQQQYFRVKPQNTAVVEGQTVELQCRIGNQAGSVQWSKDGFVLGKFLFHHMQKSLVYSF